MTETRALDIINEFQTNKLIYEFSSQRKRFRLHKKAHAQIWVQDAIKCRWMIDNTHNT